MYYKIQSALNKNWNVKGKWFEVVRVSGKYHDADEIVVATFQMEENTNDICVYVTKNIVRTDKDKEMIKESISEYFAYIETHTEKVEHHSSKWAKPKYKTIVTHHTGECYEWDWDEEKSVVDVPGHYKDYSWNEDVEVKETIYPEFNITFKNYF